MLSSISYRLKRLDRMLRAKLALFAPHLNALGAPEPILKLEYAGASKSRTLIVFLPGIDDVAEDFERRGFIQELRREGVPADAVALDAHYGYYARRVIVERITQDAVHAAQASGYRRIWLVGASMGGFGAAWYAAHHPAHVAGVLLLAPYLGEKALIDEIAAAGGLRGWNPGAVPASDHARHLWAWFKQVVDEEAPPVQIHLGYGVGDMFARANALLAAALPGAQVFAIPGRHDWHTWKKIWRAFLLQGAIHQ